MVDQIRVVQFTTPASPGTLDITHPDVTEDFTCAIIIASGSTSDDTNNTHGVVGVGFVSSNPDAAVRQEAAIGLQLEDGSTASDTGTRNSAVECISIPSGTAVATANVLASYDSSIPGGVRLSFATTTVQTKCVAILFAGLAESCIKDLQIQDVEVLITCPDSAGGGGTFEPDLLVWLTNDHPGGSVNEAEGQPSIGFTVNDGVPTQIATWHNIDESDPTDADGVARTDRSFGWLNLAARGQQSGGVTSFDPTGFNAASDLPGGIRCTVLALKFSGAVRFGCAQMPVAGSTGLQEFNDLGFTPDVVFGFSHLLAALNTLTDGPTASAGGYFVTGRHGSRAYTWRYQEGLDLNPATSAANTRQEDVAVLTYEHGGTIAQRATWAGASGSGGFLLDFSEATAGHLTALGIQLIPTSPPGRDHSKAPPQGQGAGRVRRVLTAGVKRAARTGRFLRTLLRNRAAAERARRAPAPELAVTLHLTTDPGKRTGDNAFPGSVKGGNAEAGSIAGDSA